MYNGIHHIAVPQLRLVPSGPQYNVKIQTPFTLQCIAVGYPVTTSIRWIKIQGNGQSGKIHIALMSILTVKFYIFLTELLGSSINNTATLTTQSITLGNAGVYSCIAFTPYTSINITATINVVSKFKIL